jgi:hypothetical protein
MSFIVGGLVLAGSSVASGIIGANASKSAANAQVTAANNAINTQEQNFDTVNAEFAPNRNLGYGADNLLAQLFGIGNPTASGASNAYPGANYTPNGPTSLPTNNVGAAGSNGSAITGVSGTTGGVSNGGNQAVLGGQVAATNPAAIPGTGTTAGTQAGGGSAAVGGAAQNPNYSNFYNSPGYQFTLGQGQQAIDRSASAAGNAYSSTTLGALNNYAQGAASTQYNNYVQQLMGLAGLGATATQGTANAATTTANNVSSAQLGIGNANASGIAGSAGAWNSAIQGVASGIGTGALGVGNIGTGGNPYSDPNYYSSGLAGAFQSNAAASGYTLP